MLIRIARGKGCLEYRRSDSTNNGRDDIIASLMPTISSEVNDEDLKRVLVWMDSLKVKTVD
jgi:hypothetical protein